MGMMGRKKAKPTVDFPLRAMLGKIVHPACEHHKEVVLDVFITEKYPNREHVVNMSTNKNQLLFPGLGKFEALQLARMLLRFAGDEYDETKTCDQGPGYKGTVVL